MHPIHTTLLTLYILGLRRHLLRGWWHQWAGDVPCRSCCTRTVEGQQRYTCPYRVPNGRSTFTLSLRTIYEVLPWLIPNQPSLPRVKPEMIEVGDSAQPLLPFGDLQQILSKFQVTCRRSVVSSGYSGFLHQKTDFIIIFFYLFIIIYWVGGWT